MQQETKFICNTTLYRHESMETFPIRLEWIGKYCRNANKKSPPQTVQSNKKTTNFY